MSFGNANEMNLILGFGVHAVVILFCVFWITTLTLISPGRKSTTQRINIMRLRYIFNRTDKLWYPLSSSSKYDCQEISFTTF
jgi:hypothetical protein